MNTHDPTTAAIEAQIEERDRLRAENDRIRAENDRIRAENDRLRALIAALKKEPS